MCQAWEHGPGYVSIVKNSKSTTARCIICPSMNFYAKNVIIILRNLYCHPGLPGIFVALGVVLPMCGNSFPAFRADRAGLDLADSPVAGPAVAVPGALGEHSNGLQVLEPAIIPRFLAGPLLCAATRYPSPKGTRYFYICGHRVCINHFVPVPWDRIQIRRLPRFQQQNHN